MYLGAVHAAPGAAGEVTGVPQAAVGAELAVDPAAVAHVVQLTRGLGVRVVPGHVRTCSVVNLDIYTSTHLYLAYPPSSLFSQVNEVCGTSSGP